MTTKDIPSWFAKILLGAVGVLLTMVGAWVARSADKQATALEELKAAVYAGREDTAVLKNRVTTVEGDVAEIKQQVKYIESRLHKEQ